MPFQRVLEQRETNCIVQGLILSCWFHFWQAYSASILNETIGKPIMTDLANMPHEEEIHVSVILICICSTVCVVSCLQISTSSPLRLIFCMCRLNELGAHCAILVYPTHRDDGGASGGVMVSKLDQQTYTSEFESHWVPLSYGLVQKA